MKVLYCLLLLLNSSLMVAQVGISIDGSTPDPSAGLDVKFTNKGFLPPRMTHAALNSISNPANGLVVYCTDCGSNGLGSLSMFMAGQWYALSTNCMSPLSPLSGTHVAMPTQIVWNWNSVTGATGYKWNTSNNYAAATDMGIIITKTETGLSCNTSYTRYAWAYNTCGNSIPVVLTQTTSLNPPVAPSAGTHVPSESQIIWKWNTVAGATGYKWNTTNDYATATDMGTNTSKTETGLTTGITYTRYVWDYNTCGTSTASPLSQLLIYIGASYGGGIVFYIDGSGQHGLISSTSDQSTGAAWGCLGTIIGGTSTAIGSGQVNTIAIINGCSTTGIAAQICNDLILNGYNDWFLPSILDLGQMYQYRSIIGGFALDAQYWSSSEYSTSPANWAWRYDFVFNASYPTYWNVKTTLFHVRAIRAF